MCAVPPFYSSSSATTIQASWFQSHGTATPRGPLGRHYPGQATETLLRALAQGALVLGEVRVLTNRLEGRRKLTRPPERAAGVELMRSPAHLAGRGDRPEPD